MYFGKKMKEIRDANGWTLEEMAKKLGTTKQALSKYERGERSPKFDVAAKFARILKVPLSELTDEVQLEYDNYQNTVVPETISKSDAIILESIHDNDRIRMLVECAWKMEDQDIMMLMEVAHRIIDLYNAR